MIRNISANIVFACLFLVVFQERVHGFLYEYFYDGYFTSIHVLIVNPKEHLILPVKALGEKVSRETVRTLANRYGAVAATNGGFWKPEGTPVGALKIKGHWFGTPIKPRGAIGWSTLHSSVLIDRILTNYSLEECPIDSWIKVLPVSFPPATTEKEWEEREHIVGGTPVLVRNGYVIEDFSPEQTLESFLVNKHSRTAVGIKNNGDWVFVVVDGQLHGLFGGMTMKELAHFMLYLGCVEALNLDGGGSSTLVIEGEVINDPSGKRIEEGKHVEAVSDAILIFPAA